MQIGKPAVISTVAAVALLAGCGSSTNKASSATTAATSGAASATQGATTAGTVIKIGLIDPVSGPAPYPSVIEGANGAVHYINTTLKGIGGHPISLDVCNSDGTPETNVNCANRFVQDKVVAVVDGYDAGAGAELPVLHSAGIPLVGQIAKDATSDHDPKSFFFGPPDAAFAVGPLQVLGQQGIKKIAFAAVDDPTFHAYFNGYILPVASKLGLDVSVSYYEPTNTNWPVIASTLESKSPQLAGLVAGSQGDCTSMLKALRSSGYQKQVILGACSDFASTDQSQATGVISYTGNWLPSMAEYATATAKTQIQAYDAAMKATGHSGVTDEQASGTFAALVDVSKIASGVQGALDGTSLSSALLATKNFQSFLGPVITCDHNSWPGTSACANSVLIIKVAKDGVFKPDTSNGGFEKLNTTLIH